MTDLARKDEDLGGTAALPSPSPEPLVRPASNIDPDLPPPEEGLEPPPDMDASFGEVVSAGWTAETIRTDAWDHAARKRRELADRMFDILPSEAKSRVWSRFADNSTGWTTFEDIVIAEAAEAAKSPEAAADWAGFPLSADALQQRIQKERRNELDAAQRVLDQPGGGLAEFVGASARAMTDQASLMMMPLGGGSGSALRIIAGEAALGALGEAAILPREYEVAAELDLPDPDPLARIATGALLGGGLSAGILGIAKGAGLWRARRAGLDAARPEGADALDFEARVDDAEDALTGRMTVQQAVAPRMQPTVEAGTLPAILSEANYDEGATLSAIIGVESGGNATAANPNSSALGAGQFIAGTWLDMIRRHRPDLMQGRTANEVLGLRTDPALSREMTLRYMRENQQKMRDAGIAQVGAGETYLAHFMGPDGAIKALRAPLDTPLARVMTPKAITANKGIRYNGKSFADFTVYDLRMWARQKMARSGAGGAAPSSDLPVFSGPTSRGYTGTNQMRVSDDMRVDVQYEIVDAATLRRAGGDLQPRDRSGVNSDIWIAEQAARLDPAQLGRSPNASTGAPLVGPDNVIESGNGRFGIISRAYEHHPDRADAYRAFLKAEGFAIPEGVKQPVLIARRQTELDHAGRVRLVNDAQDSGVAVMRPVEMAKSNARNLTDGRMALFRGADDLDAEGNKAFVKSWLEGLPSSLRSAVTDGDNGLNSFGRRTLREAIFARAWPEDALIEMMTEGAAGEMKTLMDALVRAAPDWALLRADIEAGRVAPEFDLTGNVLDAMRLIVAARQTARREKQTMTAAMADLLDSPDLLDGSVAPVTLGLLRKMWRGGRTAPEEEIAGFLSRYAAEARRASDAADGFFAAPTPVDVLRALDRETFVGLPDDVAAAMGERMPAPREPTALPDEGFAEGAESPEAIEADTIAAAEHRRGADMAELAAIVERGGSAEEIAAHPAVRQVLRAAEDITPTHLHADFDTPEFWSSREYRARGEILLGREAAEDYLYAQARRIAWTDEGLSPPSSISQDRKAVILLGPPAAGKSSIANPYARDLNAAIIDADEAKKIIPEYQGGLGASAVHEESGILIDGALSRAVQAGDNMVLPKVGGSERSIADLAAGLRGRGYSVDIVLVDVPPAETWRRMIGRFVATGRLIPPDVMQKGIDGAPRTYDLLKKKGVAHGYAKIDNGPAPGQPRGIIEDDAGILPAAAIRREASPADAGRNGGNGRPPLSEAVRGDGADPGLTIPDDDLAALRAEYDGLAVKYGETEFNARDMLDDLDADDAADAVIQACAITPGGSAE